MANVRDIVSAMERFAPKSLAEEWDNVGLLLGRTDKEALKIIIMLDLDKNGVSEALDVGADMIITHHPVIRNGLKSVTDEDILTVIENKISVLSMHTNLDVAKDGVNQTLAEELSLYNIEEVDLDGFVTRGGEISVCCFGDFLSSVKKLLGIDNLRYVGNKNKPIKRVCVLGGSGGDFIERVRVLGFDAYVTSDIKYHQAQLAEKIGLCVVDAGHFETENPVIYKVARYLRSCFDDAEIITSLRNKSYIKYE